MTFKMCLLIFMNIHLISLFTIYIMKALKFDLYAALSSKLWCHKIVAKMLTKQSTFIFYSDFCRSFSSFI